MSTSSLYFFIFGRNPKLSLAELFSYLSSRAIEFSIHTLDNEFCVFEIKSKLNPEKIAQILAGTIKLGKIYLTTDNKENLLNLLHQANFYWEDSKTLNYSISTHGTGLYEQFFYERFKKLFKEIKQKAFLKKPNPSGLWNALQRKGFMDIVVCKSKSTIFIGRTIAAYNINLNKKRYEQRPHVEETISSSVRFSRILVNLSQKSNGRLLDPFCGIGTILQEAMLMGFNVIGSELQKDRVVQCKRNLEWIRTQFLNLNSKQNFEVMQSDVRKLDEKIPKSSIDTIVTEPELGPFLKNIPTYNEVQSIIKSLEDIYISTFRVVDTLLKPDGTFIMVLPQIEATNGKVAQVNIQSLTQGTRLKSISSLSNIDNIISFPLYYKETWHRIGRLIYLFQKH
ncbi:MAG: methyltransferase domain-containing protein [Promethearchaeota archaeon]|nr:MAG: methyltransferase domain-containing protein [Candidatus Lokiarchaeota archaeon]